MSDGTHRITIPNHKRLNPYTLKAIIKDAGIKAGNLKNFFNKTNYQPSALSNFQNLKVEIEDVSL